MRVGLEDGTNGFAHRAEVHRDVRGVGDQVSGGVEHRAREIETVADVGAHRRSLEDDTHLLRDRSELVVEHLQQDGVDLGVGVDASANIRRVAENEVVAFGAKSGEAGIDDDGARGVQDQRGSRKLGVERDVFSKVDWRLDECPTRPERRLPFRGATARLHLGKLGLGAPELDGDTERCGFDWVRGSRVSEFAPVQGLERRPHSLRLAEVDVEGGFGAAIAQSDASMNAPNGVFPCIGLERAPTLRFERRKRVFPAFRSRFVETHASGVALAMPFEVGHAHSERRERACVWVEHELPHPEPACDEASILTTCSAEDDHSVGPHVMAAADRDLLNGGRHVLDRDTEKPVGDFRRCARDAELAKGRRNPVERAFDRGLVERERKAVRRDPPKKERDVSQRKPGGVRLAVTQRAGVGPRAPGTYRHPFALERADGTAARGDRVELDHGRSDPHPSDLAFELTGHFAGVSGDVRGGAAHVEADDFAEPELIGDSPRCDDPRCRARQHGVAPDEAIRIDEPSVALHHAKPTGAQIFLEPRHVVGQQRCEVGVGRGRVGPAEQPELVGDLV